MTGIKDFLSKYKFIIAGVFIGAIGGYLYYHFIGCNSGTCAITSKPLNSTLYGALMGGLFLNIFKKKIKESQNKMLESIKKYSDLELKQITAN